MLITHQEEYISIFRREVGGRGQKGDMGERRLGTRDNDRDREGTVFIL